MLEEYKVPQGEPLLDPRIAFQMSNILSDNNARLITLIGIGNDQCNLRRSRRERGEAAALDCRERTPYRVNLRDRRATGNQHAIGFAQTRPTSSSLYLTKPICIGARAARRSHCCSVGFCRG